MIAARAKRPAVLIFNPRAGRLSETSRDSVAERLERGFSLDVRTTVTRRDAVALSREAAEAGVPLVIAFGGDGHVNEVVNGVAGTRTSVAVIPGGTMNVFARSLGIPRKANDAADHLLSLDPTDARRIDLGVMDDTFFTFAAGCGFDAEVAGFVETHLAEKRFFGEPFFYWSAFRILAGAYRGREARMTLRTSDRSADVAMAIVCNAGPYAYLLGVPIRLLPSSTPGSGLDVVALTHMRIGSLPWYAWRAVAGGSISRHRHAISWHELDGLTISADAPFARHVDGEVLDPRDTAEFRSAPGALEVLA